MSTTTVTPALVKELRDRTGVGMAKCKEALEQAHGNIEEAISILRKAGMASAVKKEGRLTKEGMVLAHETADVIAVVEVDALQRDFHDRTPDGDALDLGDGLGLLHARRSTPAPSRRRCRSRSRKGSNLGGRWLGGGDWPGALLRRCHHKDSGQPLSLPGEMHGAQTRPYTKVVRVPIVTVKFLSRRLPSIPAPFFV